MIKVSCPSCNAAYDVDEHRLPARRASDALSEMSARAFQVHRDGSTAKTGGGAAPASSGNLRQGESPRRSAWAPARRRLPLRVRRPRRRPRTRLLRSKKAPSDLPAPYARGGGRSARAVRRWGPTRDLPALRRPAAARSISTRSPTPGYCRSARAEEAKDAVSPSGFRSICRHGSSGASQIARRHRSSSAHAPRRHLRDRPTNSHASSPGPRDRPNRRRDLYPWR